MRSTPNAPDKEHNYNTLHKNYGKRGNIQQDITTESENTYSWESKSIYKSNQKRSYGKYYEIT